MRKIYRATDRNGNVLRKGDEIIDFRGDVAYFRGVSRGPEYNGTAKVLSVRDPEADRFGERENYASVFDITVVIAGTETTYVNRQGDGVLTALICEETDREGGVVYLFNGPVRDGENVMAASLTDVSEYVESLKKTGFEEA